MPKIKTRKSLVRRFRVTKTGKVLHRRSFGRHLRTKKRGSRIRKYSVLKLASKSTARKIRKILGVSSL